MLDGWQVELFAVDVDSAAGSAADAVAQFFGHAGQESGFARADREIGLDRIVSYLRDVLPGLGKKTKSEIRALTPARWAAARRGEAERAAVA